MDKYAELGRQIKKLREKKKFTQQELANKVEINLSYMGNIEIGAKKPSLHILFRIAEKLNVKVQDLFTF
jgi:transcriptional regulator with XRE-family HTH domain